MQTANMKFENVAAELARLTTKRERVVSGAFQAFETRYPTLANEVLEYIGSRQRAACWMCAPHRASEGRIPYDLLADGDEDSVWVLLESVS